MAKNSQNKNRFVKVLGLFLAGLMLFGAAAYAYNTSKKDPKVKGTATEVDVCKNKLTNEDISITSDRNWYLKDYTDASNPRIKIQINKDKFVSPDEIYLLNEADDSKLELAETSDKTFEYDPTLLAPGNYKLHFTAKDTCYVAKSKPLEINVSYPVMVLWTQDWEGDDVKQAYLDDLVRISKQYGVPMTHYWNPRIYIENSMSKARQDYLTKWVQTRRDVNGEEIGLHIHMFDNLVDEVGLNKLPERWGQRTDGYDRLTGQYSTSDFEKVLDWSIGEFTKHGFAKPTNFRAGGWFASEQTLQALEEKGFKIDSSGRDPYKIGANKHAGYWTLNYLSEPYHPSKTNQSIEDVNPAKNWNILEVPNNAGNTWEHSAETIIDRFKKNYLGGAAQKSVVFNILSHPHWHYMDGPKLDKIFKYTKQYNYTEDQGPVVYMTMNDAIGVWEKGQ